jgi:hypothetical protein
MLKKDKLQIINLIIEAQNEVDEALTRQATTPRKPRDCYRDIVNYDEDLRGGKWKAEIDFTTSNGQTIKKEPFYLSKIIPHWTQQPNKRIFIIAGGCATSRSKKTKWSNFYTIDKKSQSQ